MSDLGYIAEFALPLNEHGRVECVCGRSVLPKNWPNHLLTVSYGREHRVARGEWQEPLCDVDGCDLPASHGHAMTDLYGLDAMARRLGIETTASHRSWMNWIAACPDLGAIVISPRRTEGS